MNKRTLKALKDSIEHWEENCRAEAPGDVLLGPDECALCALFIDKGCRGCPVSEAVNYSGCWETPYANMEVIHDHWWANDTKENRTKFRRQARREVNFLKGLLP